ncbi:MAG: hypothetical protein MUC56_14105 [Thermoanaerobaculales bacterium]|jgi:hypothetical protein|nr:hypothetical protein [Thermoanaerobaculales bacterium]
MEVNYLRGAFIAYEPDGYPDQKRTIPFRFNPESLSRQLSVEQGKGEEGAGGGGGGKPADAENEQSADTGGSLKESFNVLIRVDAADRHGPGHEASKNLPPELGVAPEIAALEDLLYPATADSDTAADGSEPVEAKPRRPTVLFVWGRKRICPVRITAMTIEETMYNRELYPLRAEIDVTLEVLGEGDAKDNVAVRSALDFTASNRRELARLFLDNTAEQSSNTMPL